MIASQRAFPPNLLAVQEIKPVRLGGGGNSRTNFVIVSRVRGTAENSRKIYHEILHR